MNRRNFLKNSSLAGFSITAGSLVACQTSPAKEISSNEENTDSFELEEWTIPQFQKAMENGRYTSAAITQLYLDRIIAIDRKGPALNSVIEINPDAISIAKSLDKEREDGKVRGPLHGIPVLIKDNIDTADKMQTTAGALALEGNIATRDAFIVKQLRDAGAVLLGKTNLSEWANFRSGRSCSGWSSRGGQTKSAYLLTHNPCGSSAGSGVAASANLCAIAIGTETDGSITCPSSVAALAGLKPTVGLWSRSGIIPISHTQDTAGPMCRSVTDVAITLSALTATDKNDPASMAATGKADPDYTKYLDKKALAGKRIGIEKKPQGDNHYLHALQNKCKELLVAQGATVIEIEYLDKINELGKHEYNVLKYEFKDGVNKYLSQANAKVKTLAEVIAFNKANEDKAMPFFKQDTLEACEALGGLDSSEYKAALESSFTGSRKILDEVMNTNQLDAIAGLTMGPSCAIDRWYGDRWGDVSLTSPAAIAGYPHITVPAGEVYALPVGFSFFGTAFSEPVLIGLAYSFEQANPARKKPAFVASIQ
ncbi:amidase [Flavihumibacter sp. UBA7668]|uniref:amidase n=1 Tax=Flavihumibacter sp. UBA7668 TaxID=1946542 RepID=UPI0025BBE0B5|nr:amidase [Flavihumibacter sp. UBA7668]